MNKPDLKSCEHAIIELGQYVLVLFFGIWWDIAADITTRTTLMLVINVTS